MNSAGACLVGGGLLPERAAGSPALSLPPEAAPAGYNADVKYLWQPVLSLALGAGLTYLLMFMTFCGDWTDSRTCEVAQVIGNTLLWPSRFFSFGGAITTLVGDALLNAAILFLALVYLTRGRIRISPPQEPLHR